MRTTTVSASSIPIWRAPADHRFYVSSAIVALVVAMVAFAPGLLDTSSRRGPLTPLAALHAATFTGWRSCTSRRRSWPAAATFGCTVGSGSRALSLRR